MEEHGHGLGTVTPEMVEQRAREIAETNGRLPQDFNQSDLEQAKAELLGELEETVDEDDTEEESPVEASEEDAGANLTDRDEIPDESGHRVTTEQAGDEQTFAERLVEEGKDEADHEQMIEGNRLSRKRDRL